MQVHIDRNGERFGPYSEEDINAYLANGTLLLTDLAWHEGLPAWVPLSQTSGVGQTMPHVEYVNGKPKTVRAFSGKLLFFWIGWSIIIPPVFVFSLNSIGLGPTDGSISENLWFSGGLSVFMIIFSLGVRRPSNCIGGFKGFALNKKHYTFFGMQIWKE